MATGDFEGTLQFGVDTGVKPATYPKDPPDSPRRNSGKFENLSVPIHDARAIAGDLSLDHQGFLITGHTSAVEDFFDEEQIRSIYYPEVQQLVKDFTGAGQVAIFDHTFRVEDEEKRKKLATGAPVPTVHNDYTDWSGPKRLRDISTEEEAEARLKKRFMMINVWRPLMEPVLSNPLALCDASTIGAGDLIAADHIYPDRRGETYRMAYGAQQRWYYFSEMRMDEAVLIKCFDSERDGRARFAAHGAVQQPAAEGVTPRESIEVRTIGFFD